MSDFDLALWDPAGTDSSTESVRWSHGTCIAATACAFTH